MSSFQQPKKNYKIWKETRKCDPYIGKNADIKNCHSKGAQMVELADKT